MKLVLSVPPGDDELCRRFFAGDGDTFGELVRRHQSLIYRLARRYAATPDEAFDLSQRAFLQAFQAARRSSAAFAHRRPIAFRAWLIRICVNLGKNHLRDKSRWHTVPLEATLEDASALGDPVEREQRLVVRRAVHRLPNRQREVLTLRIDGELSFADIAQALGISENNAKTNFHYAVRRLRKLVSDEPFR